MDDNLIKQILGNEWDDARTPESNVKLVVDKLNLYKKLGDITGFFLQKFQKWTEGIPDDPRY